MGHWSPVSRNVALSIAALTIVAAIRLKVPVLRLCVAAHVLLAATLGELVWASWKDFSRVLLPLAVLGAIACWPPAHADETVEAEDDRGSSLVSTIDASRRSIAVRTASGG
jgi:hypothetical protein